MPVCEDAEIHHIRTVSSLAKKAKAFKGFKGKKDDELVLHQPRGIKAEQVLFLGIGKLGKIDRESFRAMSGKAVKKCIALDYQDPAIAVPSDKKVKKSLLSILEPMLEGACLGNHLFDKYKKKKEQQPLKTIKFLVQASVREKYKGLPGRIQTICEGTCLARDWVSTPPNDKTPELFAKSIVARAKKSGLKVTVLDEKYLRQNKFGAILAVGAGSRSKPRMVLFEYRRPKAKKTIVLVGKGVTFDSGGINIKPSGSLEDMKMDMSGAAAVSATLITVAKLKPQLNVIGAVPIVENMPSGEATRPGDIVKSFKGKTIEIGNTDAEGRLILVDAMAYAIKTYKPQYIIDMATLTGACVIALGEKIAGVFSSDDELADKIIHSGEQTFERCWRMPLPEDYQEMLKSDFADISNIGNVRWAGAITAALFLKEFVGDTPWAHIDIAGPAYQKKDSAYCRTGGTGFGVRLLCDVMSTL